MISKLQEKLSDKVFIAKVFLLLMFIFSIVSCQNQEYDRDYDTSRFVSGMSFPEYKEPIPNFNNALLANDTLTITVEYAHCGEWGGHKEIIRLFNEEADAVMAYFTRDSVCCSKIIANEKGIGVLDDRERIVILSLEKQLSDQDLQLLNLFFHRILELSLHFDLWYYRNQSHENRGEKSDFDEKDGMIVFSHTDVGQVISIESSSSEFKIVFFNLDMQANTWYGLIRDKIFGSLIDRAAHN